MTTPREQTQYQVRFDWGRGGARAAAGDADIVIAVDVLPSPDALDREGMVGVVIEGSLRNRSAVAQWVLAFQAERGDRVLVAVIAAGQPREDGSIRFAVEDQLGAGAIIDALATAGIDYCSPEAAAACASFTSLRGAVGHLVSASVSGLELAKSGRIREVELACEVDVSDAVRVLQE